MQLDDVLVKFGIQNHFVKPFGKGLINKTWIVTSDKDEKEFILQCINKIIFKSPENIAFNIRMVSEHLQHHNHGYFFPAPLQTKNGKDLVETTGEYFRLFPFIKNTHTIDVVQNPQQAYEAAKQFGKFTKVLSALNPSQLKITLPDFHNLSLRFKQFEEALQNGNKLRIEHAKNVIAFIQQQKNNVDEFEKIKSDSDFKIRVTHHDTKISNVLFDENDKGICVIDLDTIMPGYFISDVGDMMRTYLSPVNEEEKDFTKIEIRKDFYHAIVNGYLSEMGEKLTQTETKHFFYAGKFIIYMQALRFLTDYLNNDTYYGSKYEDHNFVRAGNQVTLLIKLLEKEKDLISF